MKTRKKRKRRVSKKKEEKEKDDNEIKTDLKEDGELENRIRTQC